MKVEAEKLNEYVNIVVNGVGKKGMNPLNTAITLLNDDNKLSLIAQTSVTTVKVYTDIDATGFTSCSIENTLFTQLLSKLSGEIELSLSEGKYLLIKGKGEYKIIAVFDYNGNIALIPDVKKLEVSEMKKLNFEELVRSIGVCKNACPEDLNVPVLYNIYYGTEGVVATNDSKLIRIPNKTDFLGRLSVANLSIITSALKGDVYYKIEDKRLIMQDSNNTLVVMAYDDSEDYPAKDVGTAEMVKPFELEYEQVMEVIEKGKLFISPFDRNIMLVSIGKEGITLESKDIGFIEEVKFSSPTEADELKDLQINLLDLYSILTSCVNGPIKMSCTQDGPLYVSQGDYTGLISLYE